ncbi:hypothetical protein SODALDRAFT_330205 [Sodiomyces alkalinus F11]|uniref:Uncharacterized protein n=1 Tax=Sodiomyces alkalinus (strain CBS 110278 / VKM F-3762 / F11) TaxID=1314773 RepID=A0A3N2Q1A2_SODAK|nr:hypothetical protein SODALDRAFT_330205 [Sodiomyces alkalinus F11]ROT40486.1 hypothetical protein SODALDRAFT_330205 [Sodiomyces alkalinus F11]
MSTSRAITLRRLAVARPRPSAFAPLISRRFYAQDKENLGGPGGQDPPPKTPPGVLQDRNFVMTVAGAAVVIATLLYVTAKPRRASDQEIEKKVASMGEKAKEKLRDVRLDELSGRANKTPAERGLGAYRTD